MTATTRHLPVPFLPGSGGRSPSRARPLFLATPPRRRRNRTRSSRGRPAIISAGRCSRACTGLSPAAARPIRSSGFFSLRSRASNTGAASGPRPAASSTSARDLAALAARKPPPSTPPAPSSTLRKRSSAVQVSPLSAAIWPREYRARSRYGLFRSDLGQDRGSVPEPSPDPPQPRAVGIQDQGCPDAAADGGLADRDETFRDRRNAPVR